MDNVQLDLFGNPIVPQPPVTKKTKATERNATAPITNEPVKANADTLVTKTEDAPTVNPTPAIIEETAPHNESTISELAADPLPAQTDVPNQVVYSNEAVAFKIKKVNTFTVEEPSLQVPEANVVEEEAEEPFVTVTKTEKLSAKKPAKRGRKSFKEMDAEADLIDVPSDEVLQKKAYYPISEVAAWFHVNTSQIRLWENEFDILQPRKTRKGDRLFRVEDIKNLVLIHHLLRNKKYSFEGAREYLKTNREQADKEMLLKKSLTNFKSFLLELKANLKAY